MIRRPPRSTLFLSTTLFRSVLDDQRTAAQLEQRAAAHAVDDVDERAADREAAGVRERDEIAGDVEEASLPHGEEVAEDAQRAGVELHERVAGKICDELRLAGSITDREQVAV